MLSIAARMRAKHAVFIASTALLALSTTLANAEDKTVSAVMHAPLRILDPVIATAHITRNHGYMVYDQLVAIDGQGVVQPQMASWTISDDNLTYTFTLREGLLFHDGANVTAADAVASVKRWGARDGAAAFLMAATDSIEAVDETTLVWTLNKPFPLLLNVLAKESTLPAFVMPERVAETPADTQITEAIGSGPFEFLASEFQLGVKAVYQRFDGYKPRTEPTSGLAGGKVVNVDRVEWVTMPDSQTAVNALMTGEIDYIENTAIDLLSILENNPDIVAESHDGFQVFARLNFKHPPFDNAEIRRAALTALSQEQVMATMVGNPNYYSLCGAVFGCGTWLGDETGADSLKAGGDKGKAREMLEAAGYDNSPVVVMQATDLGPWSTVAVVVASQLREAGFNVDLQPMDFQSLVSRRASMNHPSEGGWNVITGGLSMIDISNPLVHPLVPAPGDTGFPGWPDDPELEALRAAFMEADTLEKQQDTARQVQARVLDNVILIPLGEYNQVQTWRTNLTDKLPIPVPVFWNLDIEN